MIKLNPYLNFDGKCEEAFNMYKSIFRVELVGPGMMRFGDMQNMEIPEDAKSRIVHVAIQVGNDTLMGSDTFPGMPFTAGNNNYISVHPESKEEADRIFNELSAGGQVEMPMADQFWGDYYGSLIDKFGIGWMVNYHKH